jgi:hypothetical protein
MLIVIFLIFSLLISYFNRVSLCFQGAEAGLPRENGDQSSNMTMRAERREKI